ncbi:MAG: RDD family protein, partial [Gemmatimonadales bacterium]|nr:RDD family protein [Gemmatimonadales bacterium]
MPLPGTNPPPTRRDYRQHLEIETPEHVVLDLEIAGIGSRILAAVIDTAIIAAGLLAVLVVMAIVADRGLRGSWAMPIYGAVTFMLMWGYFTFYEALREGQTPGKRKVGIRVLRDTGHPVTFAAAAVRNLLRIADFFPPPYLGGTLLIALHPRGKRLGDLIAGTIVARDRPAEASAPVRRTAGSDSLEVLADDRDLTAPLLTDDEFRLLAQFAERSGALDPVVRRRFASSLAARFASHLPPQPVSDEQFILALHADESARRRGRLAGRGSAGRSVADRLAARQAPRWDEFQSLAERASRHGLGSLLPDELPDFAARYRE